MVENILYTCGLESFFAIKIKGGGGGGVLTFEGAYFRGDV